MLQAPFCVHPKTGKVCIPIDPAASSEFDPEDVPTVQELTKTLTTNRDKDEVRNYSQCA